MSRAGYSDDLDPLDLGRWRAQVNSAIRGKRGQNFFRELLTTLDAMPEKKLIQGDLEAADGCVCTLGAFAKARGIDPTTLDTYEYEDLGQRFNIARQLAQEVMFMNDEGTWRRESPEERWARMRVWVQQQIRS